MTQTQNGSICAEEYVVKRGDSFYLIAHKLGVPLRDLLAANRDIHPARLMVGDVLCIPREEDDRPQGGGSGNAGGSAGNNGSTSTGNIGTANGNTGSGSTTTGNSSNAGNAGSTSQQGDSAISNGSAGTSSSTSSAENAGNANNAGNAGSSYNNTAGNGNASNDNTGSSASGGSSSGSSPSANGTATNNSPIITPPPATPVPGLACPIEEQVTIAQGQTIADIQLQNLLSRNTLQTANPALDLDTLEAGQTICVPTENIACRLPSTYTLAAGETLEAVAMRFNLPLGSLLRVNPCLAPQDFEEGVTVILPR